MHWLSPGPGPQIFNSVSPCRGSPVQISVALPSFVIVCPGLTLSCQPRREAASACSGGAFLHPDSVCITGAGPVLVHCWPGGQVPWPHSRAGTQCSPLGLWLLQENSSWGLVRSSPSDPCSSMQSLSNCSKGSPRAPAGMPRLTWGTSWTSPVALSTLR